MTMQDKEFRERAIHFRKTVEEQLEYFEKMLPPLREFIKVLKDVEKDWNVNLEKSTQ